MENTTLLTYYFPSQPYPLEVSANNHAMNGALTVVVSDPSADIYAQEITIYLPIGAGQPGYLSSSTPIASCNTTRWSIGTAQLVKSEELPLVLRVSGKNASTPDYHSFNCLPASAADQLIDFDLQFTFQIIGVDTYTGPYVVGIGESASMTEDGFGPMVFASFTAIKTAASFTLKNFIASTSSGNVNVPVGAVPRNTPFWLSWESNGSQFALYAAQNPTPIYTGASTEFEVTAGISTDTTYILQATLTNGAETGPSFESSVLYETLAVTCINADLQPNSIVNATTITSTGDITTQGNINAQQRATLGSLMVNGASTLSSLQVNSTMHVEASASFNTTSANTATATTLNAGNLNVSGPLVAQASTVQLISPPQLLLQTANFSGTQNYVAETDGIVVGFTNVQSVSGDTSGSWSLSAFILVYPIDASISFYQVGANLGSYIKIANLSVPVRKGDHFGLQFWGTYHNTNSRPQATFYFFGLGAGGATSLGLS
jgi:hypothetical protein